MLLLTRALCQHPLFPHSGVVSRGLLCLPVRFRRPTRGSWDAPILPLLTWGQLAVAKDVHPATPQLLNTAHILQAFVTLRMFEDRIGKVAPGTLPFRIGALQPADAWRGGVGHRGCVHDVPPHRPVKGWGCPVPLDCSTSSSTPWLVKMNVVSVPSLGMLSPALIR
jgi:hypothetical protein